MNGLKSTRGEKIFYAVNYGLVTLIAATCILPLIYEIALSLSSNRAIASGWVSLWPVDFSFENFSLVFQGTPILQSFFNSVEITFVGTALSMIFSILAAYPLSKSYMIGRRFWSLMCVFTMVFSGGLIPNYLNIRNLHLVNTYWALWLPGLISTYSMIIMRTFFQNVSVELDDAARIDGCSELRTLLQIYLPLSTACLATIGLFYAVGYWNTFQSVLIYINSTAKMNLSVLINNMIRNQTNMGNEFVQAEDIATVTPQGIQAAGIIVMIVPIMAVYPFLQRYFVKGVMLGSVKG